MHFFSRPEQFGEVFEQVKKARPSKLFLYQDGAREGRQDDIDGIAECRVIAESIDWECEVHKFYQEKNVGCDPSEFISQKWASWKRVIDQWDEKYSFLDNKYELESFESLIHNREYMNNLIQMCKIHRKSGKAHYESILLSNFYLNNGLAIHPTRNMINNIGVTINSTHFTGGIKELPKGLRRVFTMDRYEMEFPLKHPKYITENIDYKNRSYRISAWGHPWIKAFRMVETSWYKIKAGEFRLLLDDILLKIRKLFNGMTY